MPNLPSMPETRMSPPPQMREIAQAVAREFSLTLSELRAKTNRLDVVIPRQIAMMLIREMAGIHGGPRYSLPQIGLFFGGKHHTTVLHSIIKARDLCSEGPLMLHLQKIREAISNGTPQDPAPTRRNVRFMTGRRLLQMLDGIHQTLISIDDKLHGSAA